jgi:hypothetical protein
MSTPNINKLLRARPRPCKYGAPLGASDRTDAAPDAQLYCQRVTFTDGDYAPDGTYWGGPADLWAIFSADLATLQYLRAPSRGEALAMWSTGGRNLTEGRAPIGAPGDDGYV